MIKRVIYKVKRFIYSIKVRWKIMRSLRRWAKMLKRIRPATGQSLNRWAKIYGIEKTEGEVDGDLRKRIMEIHKQARQAQTPAWCASRGGEEQ